MAYVFENCEGFEWDSGNSNKNWYGHRISDFECEEVFFNSPITVRRDKQRKSGEPRYSALGRTGSGKQVYVAFTIRSKLIRVISAREMNRREVRKYAEEIKRNTRF